MRDQVVAGASPAGAGDDILAPSDARKPSDGPPLGPMFRSPLANSASRNQPTPSSLSRAAITARLVK